MSSIARLAVAWLLSAALQAAAQPSAPRGEVSGTAWAHTPQSLAQAIQQADVFLPGRATNGPDYFGKFRNAPPGAGTRVPVVVFLHGSSGLGLAAIQQFQRWLGSLGIASVAPDSFALPDRVTYKSPIDKASYERVHDLRASEIGPALAAVHQQPWADASRLVLAGTSEGAVAVARYAGREFAARLIYSWSCELNYFVESPRTAPVDGRPVLNVISNRDPYFSRANAWLGAESAVGHCGPAFAGNAAAAFVLVPDAPHTLLNQPATRHATAGFLLSVLGPREAVDR